MMKTHGLIRHCLPLLALCLLLTPLALTSRGVVGAVFNPTPTRPPLTHAPTPPHLAQVRTLPPAEETEPNDDINRSPPLDQANRIGPPPVPPITSWQQTVTGIITPTDDLDWFRFEVRQPASTIVVTLTDLAADFDLVLASAAETTTAGDDGLSNIVDIGRKARSTGRKARSTGRKARSTGSSVVAIGRKARSTGGDIAAFSAEPFTRTEVIDTILWTPGTYYLAVGGDNGATSDQPYTLEIDLAGSSLAVPPDVPSVLLDEEPDPTVRTLFIMNTPRMQARYPGRVNELIINDIIADVIQLANLPEVAGQVLDLSTTIPVAGTETITETYARWDTDPDNPLVANYLAGVIDGLITAATVQNPSISSPGEPPAPPPFPNVSSIVIVGGDEIIPFYRVPDLATVANEGEYLPYLREIDPVTGMLDRNSPLGGAMNYRTILTDNIYGDDRPYRLPYHPLYIPDRAVGRLVEQPAEIAVYLDDYITGGRALEIDATFPISRAVVTGYDFLSDQAQQVAQQFTNIGFDPVDVSTLISETWTADDLATTWFDNNFADFTLPGGYFNLSPFVLQSINAHFDHWEAIPADPDAPGFLAQTILNALPSTALSTRHFQQRLCYSVGCHSGLNVDRRALALGADPTYGADFPQAYMSQGGNWIGNTGYGYGDADLVGYSERLSLFITQELGREVIGRDITDTDGDFIFDEDAYLGQTIGQALAQAKQRYIRNATILDVHDIKALTIMTLYGLPFIRVKVATPQPIPSEEVTPGVTPPPIAVDIPPSGVFDRIITFTTEIADGAIAPRTGQAYPVLDGVGVTDSFVEAGFGSVIGSTPEPRRIDATQEGLPVLPQFAYDLTVGSSNSPTQTLQVQDIIFLGGSYETRAYTPLVSQIITQDIQFLPNPTAPISFESGIGIWYPEQPFDLTSTDLYTGSTVQRRDQLLVTPAQYQAGTGGLQGTMRFYDEMAFRVIYVDPGAAQAAETLRDTTPPIIESVRALRDDGSDDNNGDDNLASVTSATRLVAQVQDETSRREALSVVGVYTNDSAEWVSFDLRHRPGTNLWQAILADAPTDANYIIMAADESGNVATFTGKGTLTVPEAVALNAVSITGAATVEVNRPTSFSASTSPVTATLPFSYTWSPAPVSGQATSQATYTFPTTGTYTITLVAENVGGVVTDTWAVTVVPPVVRLASVAIAGPSTTVISTSNVYTATILPAGATPPINYTWTPTPTLGQGTASVSYTWQTTGVQTITVTASNLGGPITSPPFPVVVAAPERRLYLPVLQR